MTKCDYYYHHRHPTKCSTTTTYHYHYSSSVRYGSFQLVSLDSPSPPPAAGCFTLDIRHKLGSLSEEVPVSPSGLPEHIQLDFGNAITTDVMHLSTEGMAPRMEQIHTASQVTYLT